MNFIKKIILSSVLLFGLNSVAKADCGTITIAEMNWASAEMFLLIQYKLFWIYGLTRSSGQLNAICYERLNMVEDPKLRI